MGQHWSVFFLLSFLGMLGVKGLRTSCPGMYGRWKSRKRTEYPRATLRPRSPPEKAEVGPHMRGPHDFTSQIEESRVSEILVISYLVGPMASALSYPIIAPVGRPAKRVPVVEKEKGTDPMTVLVY
ncbi:hypothetical protein B296_00020541 [Ensete ventricosum]|uniref:Uncharacterized protein n=1 Tax=Ensete ventricosum TaxID=4639 RepID=A0A427ASU9_ENSVE|nr:hypothetical protein B296_00020541 [Ensete ventricosum]